MREVRKIKKRIHIDKENSSGLSSFVERPVPTEKEVASFERVVDREVRQKEIDSNLKEIYQDKKGKLVDVKRMRKQYGSNIMVRLFKRLFFLVILSLAAYFAYLQFFSGENDMAAVKLSISAPEQVLAGEEFTYQIEYFNPTKFAISKVRVELKYPENFIFVNAQPVPTSGTNSFVLDSLAAGARGVLEVRGQIIAPQGSVQAVSARLSYVPVNFSSEFKKEASKAIAVSGTGFQIAVESSDLAFVNQDNEISLAFFDVESNPLNDFILRFSVPEQVTVRLSEEKDLASSTLLITPDGSNSWLISGLAQNVSASRFDFLYQVKEGTESPQITIQLEKRLLDGQTYAFFEKTIFPEVVKSDLNLSLFLGGSKNSQPASFGSTLNYTLNYSNKGIDTLQDVVLMAVLDGFLFDWNTLKMETSGENRNNKMLVWNKQSIPALAELKPGDEGEINFSIDLRRYSDEYFGRSLEVSAYAQYGAGGQEATTEGNRSNNIVSKLNSDLSLVEKIRYFDDDNAPVGSGPLPPKVNETSSFRVYWTVKNNIHELSQAEVVLNLPRYVSWLGNEQKTVGDLFYDSDRHVVVWNIGRLPISVYQVDAAFSISLTPSQNDLNKILVLSPGASVMATDNETQAVITDKSEPKTTKLEDDDIASLNNSGRIE